jgi:hypothetical protein
VAGSPQHLTLAANTVATVTFDDDFPAVEVTNVDGAARVYFRADKTNPGVAATGSHVIPAAIGSLSVPAPTTGATEVRLIASAACAVSVRGLQIGD